MNGKNHQLNTRTVKTRKWYKTGKYVQICKDSSADRMFRSKCMKAANRGEKGKKAYFQGNKGSRLYGGESLRFTVVSLTITPQESDEDNSLRNLQRRNGT